MLPKHCEVCKKQTGISLCGGCKTASYCGRDHQAAEWPTHKNTCKTLKDARTKVRDEEAKLRADGPSAAGDANTPPNLLDTEAGNLWSWTAARPYLLALQMLGELLIRSWRQQGIEDALAVYLELLRLNKGDNQEARRVIPGLYLRLGRDQDAYGFCKAWGLKFKGVTNELGDPDLAYMHPDIKNSDALEGVDLWTGKFMDLTLAACVQLVKIRLLLGLQAVKQFKAALPAGAPVLSPQQLLAAVPTRYRGDILERRPELIADDDTIDMNIGIVAEQVTDVFGATGQYNKTLWVMLMEPEPRDFENGPMIYTHGSPQEAHNTFMNIYPAWAETPKAIDVLRSTVSNALEIPYKDIPGVSSKRG